ncbi:dATP/dGTP diphosphohydrolase domain-containing protein [Parvibaculum sp.]|uniref:dATP/dGTP diphosphohydrolase domain-containing protein n=1 Tax=Parvibaculum sp. TaxID=2024848 RepID=UPI00273325D4|nr:dATP/dGTP diphosphohydrolase domain-containing protein [Parvibaculum sp.]MDP3327199.1 DUF5664 domain-containing protein [Parvibaculum sp.]
MTTLEEEELMQTSEPIEVILNGGSPVINNPKHAIGRLKQPFRHVPPVALAALGRVMQGVPDAEHPGGALEYGAFNWGDAGVTATVYYDAIKRHLEEWFTSGSADRKSGENHLAHIMASCAILIDCEGMGNMDDDRPIGKTTPVVYSTPVTEGRKP